MCNIIHLGTAWTWISQVMTPECSVYCSPLAILACEDRCISVESEGTNKLILARLGRKVQYQAGPSGALAWRPSSLAITMLSDQEGHGNHTR